MHNPYASTSYEGFCHQNKVRLFLYNSFLFGDDY